MKPEDVTYVKKSLTDADRDACLKLLGCGLSTLEIVNLMHISKSTVGNIRQSHTACVNKDWNTVRRLALTIKPTVEWALRVTDSVDEYKRAYETDLMKLSGVFEPETAPAAEPAPAVVTREEFLALCASVQDICTLLVEIRDTLK